ncbi:hypothetical protein Btru_009993 [Bulinus truncatus]|nr:hypothetical protein Btru_009993 [Bulinus truncatus]
MANWGANREIVFYNWRKIEITRAAMEFRKELLRRFKNLITSGDEIYSDYTVEVENKIFPCHRFVLSACSPFFRGLLRSDMREKERNGIHLTNMSSETFKVIYGFLYHHDNGLTAENILEVWKAADFLQIDFIVTACQQIALDNINEINCHKYYWHGKLMDQNLTAKILKLITCNFDQFKDNQCVMEHEGEELLRMVRDTNLYTVREEYVVDTILKWVSHSTDDDTHSPAATLSVTPDKDKDIETISHQFTECMILPSDSGILRMDYLLQMLSVARLTALSRAYLVYLYHHHLLQDNRDARELILKVSRYKADYKPTFWPAFACHRKCSQREDVVLMPSKSNCIVVFNLTTEKMLGRLNLQELPYGGSLFVHKGQIYACGVTRNKKGLAIFTLYSANWNFVVRLEIYDYTGIDNFQNKPPNMTTFLAEGRAFIVDGYSRNIFTWNFLMYRGLTQVASVPGEMPIVHATSYRAYVIVICGVSERFPVLNIYHIKRREWQEAVILKVACFKDITSFYKDDELYFITSHGNLYVTESSGGGVRLKHVTTILNFSCHLIGAQVYCDTLFLFGKECASCSRHIVIPNVIELPEPLNRVQVIITKHPCTSHVATSLSQSVQRLII